MRIGEFLLLIFRTVRASAFDRSTAAGRSLERYRRISLTTLSIGLTKALALGSMLITVPLTLHYLGVERYGMWMTITSLVAVLSFADLGMGNGLLNAVAVANARADRKAAQTAVSSAFFMLLGMTILLGLGGALTISHVDWGRVFNVHSPVAQQEAPAAVALFMLCFAVNMPLSVVQRVQAGFQEGFSSNLWQALGSLLGLAFVYTAVRIKLGLPWLILGLSGGPLVAVTLNFASQFWQTRPWLAPSLRTFRWREARQLARSGLFFVVLNISTLLGVQSDTLIVAHFCGAESVATYSVASRLFWFIVMISTLALPAWPALGEAIERGDIGWASKALKRLLVCSGALSALLGITVVLYGQALARLWVGASVVPHYNLLISFAIWGLVSSYLSAVMMLLNSHITLARHALLFAITSCVSLALKIPLVVMLGLPGTILASSLAYSLIYIPFSVKLIRHALDVTPKIAIGLLSREGISDAAAIDAV